MWNTAKLLVAAAMLMIGGQVWAGPQAEIVNPTINFGKITQNKMVTTDFWIKSTGDETVRVLILYSGCGCTEIPLTDSTVAPGDSLQCRVNFSTGRFQGIVEKSPRVKTSASEDIIALSILADVMLDIEDGWPVVLRPEAVDVSQFSEKTRRMGTFSLENRGDEDLEIIVVDTALKSFQIRLPGTIAAGETIEGRLRVRDEALTTNFRESVTFRLEGEESHFYTLPVIRQYHSGQ